MNTRKYAKYPMLRAVIPLIAGMLACQALPTMRWWLVLAALLLALSLLLHRRPVGQSVAVMLLWMALGGCLMARSVADMAVTLPTDEVEYEAVLTSEPTRHGKVLQTDMLILGDGAPLKVKASILKDSVEGRWRGLAVGRGIRARSLLVAPSNYRGGTFDYASYLRRHGYRARTFIYKGNWTEAVVDLSRLSVLERTVIVARELRHRLLDRLDHLGMAGQDYAVIAALTLGEKSYLSKETKDDYSVSGASHVLALSGLHLGIIYSLLSFLFGTWRRQWLAQLAIMTLVWAYVLLVGLAPSVVRSASMLTIYSLVSLLERDRFSLNTISLAAVIMLCIEPQNLYDIGFQMSFLAVLGIVLFCPLLGQTVSQPFLQRHRALSWVWNMVAVSLSAQLLIFPLVAFHFGRLSTYFLLANFIAIPCAMALLYGIVALAAFGVLPFVADVLARGLVLVAKGMNGGLQWIAGLPGASVEGLEWTMPQVICIYVLIGCFYYLWWFALRHEIIGRRFG